MELQIIQSKIYEIRGQKVMLDRDLAEMYGIETKVFKQAVRRNLKRFSGDDFMFELTQEEHLFLRSQFVTVAQLLFFSIVCVSIFIIKRHGFYF
jgi:ORF6N domain.